LSAAPPSTRSATPVMKLASSEARYSAALATSQAVPILRRSGTRASRSAATWARLLPLTRARVSTAIGVSISPGRITLARMPYSAFWIATCWVKAIIDAFVAFLLDHRHGLLGRSKIAIDSHDLGTLLRESQHRGTAIAHPFARPLPGADDDGSLSF